MKHTEIQINGGQLVMEVQGLERGQLVLLQVPGRLSVVDCDELCLVLIKHSFISAGIKVLFTPPQQPVAANVSHLQDRGMLRLEMVSQQRWHLPTLLVLVRWVFGDVLSIHVTTTLTVDPDTGRLLHQQDVVNNWLTAPLVLRLLLGLSVPLATVLIKP